MPKLTSISKRVDTVDLRRGAPAIQRIVGRELQRIRERVLLRDEYTCQVCGRVTRHLEVDHITPLSMGGSESRWSDINRQSICKEPCHRLKSEREEKERV